MNLRSTMSIAIKYGLNKLPSITLCAFINAFKNEDNFYVKRQMFLTMNAILRTNSHWIMFDLDNILKVIYNATTIDKSLIREVNLGPFIHRIDDGFPLRK